MGVLDLVDGLATRWQTIRSDRAFLKASQERPELLGKFVKAKFDAGHAEMTMQHPEVYLLANELAGFLEHFNAKNYVQFAMWPRLDRATDPVEVTVRWLYGELPADKCARLEGQLVEFAERAEQCLVNQVLDGAAWAILNDLRRWNTARKEQANGKQ